MSDEKGWTLKTVEGFPMYVVHRSISLHETPEEWNDNAVIIHPGVILSLPCSTLRGPAVGVINKKGIGSWRQK